MPKPLNLMAVVHASSSELMHGLWRHEACQSARFNELEFWVETAQRLEAGLFDGMFFADSPGLHGEYRGSHETHVLAGVQYPKNDPMVLLSGIAHGTTRLGLAVTGSIIQDHPFMLARRMSTLDHATHGRVAWNIVTGANLNAARNLGYEELPPHDERYRWADEYVDVAYKLWEGSLDDGALVQDRDRGIYCDPSKVHKINHVGERYRVEGPHLVAPSPQRTPVLFQAGTSKAGRAFAARHAECVFMISITKERARREIAEIRRLAVANGRRADDLKFFEGLTFVVGSTEREAREREEELVSKLSIEGMLCHFGGTFGIDLGGYRLGDPVDVIHTEVAQTIVNIAREVSKNATPTVADIANIGRATTVVGTPEQIADELEDWQRAGVDGINFTYHTLPGSHEDFIEHVMPVLQARGLARSEPAEGTFRQNLFGTSRLNDRHPAAQYRGAFTAAPYKV